MRETVFALIEEIVRGHTTANREAAAQRLKDELDEYFLAPDPPMATLVVNELPVDHQDLPFMKIYPCGISASGSEEMPNACPVHGESCGEEPPNT